jgi:Cu(I)/Ag(I) efflux system membrane fusion protein
MRRATAIAASLALAAVGFAAGRLVPSAGSASPSADRKALRYQCPMHPAVTSDRPGTGPCCGMALEPVHEGGHPAASGAPPRPAGTVTIDGAIRQRQGVKVAAAEKGSASHALRLFGRVTPDENRVYSLNASMEGSIRDVTGVTTGSVVRRDQRLASFFSADMRSALQAYITALDVRDQDPSARAASHVVVAAGSTPNRNAQYTVERLRGMGMSLVQIEEMRRKREVPLTIDILSPADGVVLARDVTPGQKFDKGAEWFRIANLDRVWVLVDVPEGDLALARPGVPVRVSVPGRPGTLPAVVSQVPPQFDPISRTMKVRLEMANPGALLRPDMFVDAELLVERPEALTVPVDAVVDTGLRRTVFVEAGEGVYEPRAIETGWRAGNRVEVLSGLEPGDRIVVSGTFLVDSESQLRAVAAGVKGPVAKDPICGMDVEEAQARKTGLTATQGGKTHHFCSASCKETFLAKPVTAGVASPAPGHP